jgi:ABC-type phosphate transport system substrate-binding protein
VETVYGLDMKVIILLEVLFLLGFSSISYGEELVVIVNKSNRIASISMEDVKKIFLGKKKRFDSGEKIKATDYKKGKSVRMLFYKKVTNKAVKDIDSYWYRQVFTGKGIPPKAFSSASDVIEYVSGNDNAIGYIKASELSPRIKKVLAI